VWFDGVHPTSAGHLSIAEAACKQLGLPQPVAAGGARPERLGYGWWRRRQILKFAVRQPLLGWYGWLSSLRTGR
jgi:hypothetical protein